MDLEKKEENAIDNDVMISDLSRFSVYIVYIYPRLGYYS